MSGEFFKRFLEWWELARDVELALLTLTTTPNFSPVLLTTKSPT